MNRSLLIMALNQERLLTSRKVSQDTVLRIIFKGQAQG